MNAALAQARAPEPLSVRLAAPTDAAVIDAYVQTHKSGSIFHRGGWATAAKAAYGYDDATLVAMRGDDVAGVLPLIDVRAPLLGRSLISTAFSVGGGAIADDDSVVAALAAEAAAIGAERGVNYVELRSNQPLGAEWISKTGVYASFELPISQDEAKNLAVIPRRRRAEIRKGIKSAEAGELRVRLSRNTDEFYRLYALAMRNHGTPVFPKIFLDTLVRAFDDCVEINIVDFHGEPVAALLSFFDGDIVRPYYIGAAPAARDARAAEFLFWSLMERAAAKGCRRLDFGRSKVGSGPYHFKKLWGAAPQPIEYRCKLIAARALPDVNPNNPKFSSFVSMWRRLPLPLANRLGPILAANFP